MPDKYFRGENPIGQRIRFGAPDAPWYEITGIVANVKTSGLNAAPEPAALLCAFAALAAILGIIGVYGVVACRVRWQMRELAVRQALGTQPGDVTRHVLRQGSEMVAVGICAGIGGSLALSRAISGLLYQVSGNHPLTLASVAISLSAVALAACWIPARRAARVDPLVLLRYE